jgi:Domain of unknown function (DUF243)
VHKHIYVHVAPPEPEESPAFVQRQAAQAQKHYKIIFIKAPSYASYAQQQIAAAAQNQEKTLVYVLVKKPDDVAAVQQADAPAFQPSKPEVYFIKYKTQQGQSSGGAGVSVGGVSGGGGVNYDTGSSSGTSSFAGSTSGSSSFTGSTSGGFVSGGGQPASQYGPPGKSGPY